MQLSVHPRDNRKRNGRRWRARLRLVAAGTLLIVVAAAAYHWRGALGAANRAARNFLFENAYFSVREIQVRGGERVRGSEIIAVTELKRGMNLWNIDPRGIEQKVRQHPWVRRVVVRREFPRRVVIAIEERRPRAILALGKLYYVDGDGVIFAEVGAGEEVKLPLLTGLGREEITTANGALRRRIQEALWLGELMGREGRTLSEIHFDAADRLVVYTTNFPVALHMGWGDWDDKLSRLNRVLSLWKGNEERLAALDVSFREQVVARLRRAQPR